MQSRETKELINQIATGIIRWLPIKKTSSILIAETGKDDYMYASRDAIERWLSAEGYSVTRCDVVENYGSEGQSGLKFDLILLLGTIETSKDRRSLLKISKNLVNNTGRMLIACGNRFSLRQFCGDQDPFTGRVWDGIDGYASVSCASWKFMEGRLFSDKEIREALNDTGWDVCERLSVFPDIRYPQLLFAEESKPNEKLDNRLFPIYEHADSLWASEMRLVDQIAEGGMLHQMADGYLYECLPKECGNAGDCVTSLFDDATSVTLSLDRSKDNSYATILHGKEKVQKKALFPEAIEGLKRLKENHENLRKRGINTVSIQLEGDNCFMPYIEAETGMQYFSRLVDKGRKSFLANLDKFIDIIRNSSDYVKDDQENDVLERGYADLVPINSFVIDGEFVFFDQEFVIPMCPVELIISRTLTFVRSLGLKVNELISDEELYSRYHLPLYGGAFTEMADKWHAELKNAKLLGDFRRAHSENPDIIAENRSRANFSTKEYELKYVNIFRNWDRVELYVFGTGRFAKRFMEKFSQSYEVKALVDNDESKQGQSIYGTKVIAPNEIPVSDRTRVIICVKQYRMIYNQLQRLGILDICMYDPSVEVNDPKLEAEQAMREVRIQTGIKSLTKAATKESSNEDEEDDAGAIPARYHIGYVSGVFDLFHVGHLNLLERAKSMCDYLIVEVVSDEAVRQDKKVDPEIPAVDRIRIVQSIKYVDEVHEIPIDAPSTKDAWNRYHFDVQFRGSDYADNEGSKDEREFLRKHGAELVIFPYTESVSSTMLRNKLRLDKETEERK